MKQMNIKLSDRIAVGIFMVVEVHCSAEVLSCV